MRKIKRKYYNVYFMNEYMESFDTKQEAKTFKDARNWIDRKDKYIKGGEK